MSNVSDDVNVTWKWLAIALSGVVVTVGWWLYVDLKATVSNDVKDIKQTVGEIQINLSEYKTTQRNNKERIEALEKKHN